MREQKREARLHPEDAVAVSRAEWEGMGRPYFIPARRRAEKPEVDHEIMRAEDDGMLGAR